MHVLVGSSWIGGLAVHRLAGLNVDIERQPTCHCRPIPPPYLVYCALSKNVPSLQSLLVALNNHVILGCGATFFFGKDFLYFFNKFTDGTVKGWASWFLFYQFTRGMMELFFFLTRWDWQFCHFPLLAPLPESKIAMFSSLSQSVLQLLCQRGVNYKGKSTKGGESIHAKV